jgi:predicted dienelactone hydrolase
LAGLLDANNTALIGYSMGGYGALNAAGAGYSAQAVSMFGQMTGGSTALQSRSTGAPELKGIAGPSHKRQWLRLHPGAWNAEFGMRMAWLV